MQTYIKDFSCYKKTTAMDFHNSHPPHSSEILTHKAAREATDELATLLNVSESKPQYCFKYSLSLLFTEKSAN